MSVLKATNIIKSRQASVILRDVSNPTRLVRYLAQLAHVNSYPNDYPPPPSHSDGYPSRSLNFIFNSLPLTKKNPGETTLLPPQSPTSEGLDSGPNSYSSLQELTCIDIPFLANVNKPIVKHWKFKTPFGVNVHPWQQFYFDYGVTGIPKSNFRTSFPDEDLFHLSKGFGEDACFIRRDSLGVADGVGGWKKVKGANSAFFSRNLMHFACKELAKIDSLTHANSQKDSSTHFCPNTELNHFYNQIDPVKILESSYRLATESASVYKIKGSSTACIVILRNKELRIANLGDCGVMVLRDGVVVFRTTEQQHSFNFPYQLGTNSRDRPSDAQSYSVPVQRGDVIVMGSDGLFDNLFESDIEEEVLKWSPTLSWDQFSNITDERLGLASAASTTLRSRNTSFHSNLRPGDLSHALAARACHVSQQTSSQQSTPFKEKAISEGYKYQGGKRDDITVLVAVVAPCFSD